MGSEFAPKSPSRVCVLLGCPLHPRAQSLPHRPPHPSWCHCPGTSRGPWLGGCSCCMQFTPESSDRGHGWGGDSPGQPLLPWLAALSNSPASSRANAGRPRERTGPPHSHTASISWHDAFPLTTPSVFAPDQVLDTPPGTSGVLIHPPIPLSPQKAWWTHHLSLLHPEAKLLSPEESSFHDLSTDSAASGSKKAGTEQPHAWPALALPQPRSPELRASCLGRCWGWPRALLLARSCSLPGSP